MCILNPSNLNLCSQKFSANSRWAQKHFLLTIFYIFIKFSEVAVVDVETIGYVFVIVLITIIDVQIKII